MFALFTTASLLFSGLFWSWTFFTGGAAVDPRTVAIVFGWLCIASIAIGIFAVRRGSDYDRPSPAFAGALATTLFTGVATLYLAYFEWRPVAAFAEAQAAPILTLVQEPPTPAAAPRAEPAFSRRAEPSRPKPRPVIAKASARPRLTGIHAKPVDACVALKGVEKQQCRRCGTESGIAGFVCRENARAEYCAGRDGSEAGCPWPSPSGV